MRLFGCGWAQGHLCVCVLCGTTRFEAAGERSRHFASGSSWLLTNSSRFMALRTRRWIRCGPHVVHSPHKIFCDRGQLFGWLLRKCAWLGGGEAIQKTSAMRASSVRSIMWHSVTRCDTWWHLIVEQHHSSEYQVSWLLWGRKPILVACGNSKCFSTIEMLSDSPCNMCLLCINDFHLHFKSQITWVG